MCLKDVPASVFKSLNFLNGLQDYNQHGALILWREIPPFLELTPPVNV